MKSSLFVVIVLSFVFQMSIKGNTMMGTLYAIYLGAGPFTVGMIAALVALFPMVLAVCAGKVSDRIGYRFPLIFGCAVACAAMLLPAVVHNVLFILFVSQLLFGLGQIFFSVSSQNLVGALSDRKSRANDFAMLGLSTAAASMVAPVMAGMVIDHFGYAAAYLLLAIFAIIPGAAVLFRFVPNPVRERTTDHVRQQEKTKALDLLKIPSLRKAFLISGIILTGSGLFSFYFPIYGKSIGFSSSSIGLILSAHASATIVSRLVMPFLIKKFHEEKVLLYSLVLTALCFLAVPLTGNLVLLGGIAFLMGMGIGCGHPLSQVMAYNRAPEGRTGEALGVRLTVNKFVLFFVPIVFGSLGSVLGFVPIFWMNAALLFLGSYFALERKGTGSGPDVPMEQGSK